MRFNSRKQPQVQITKTVNLAGGVAYQESPKLELASLISTTFLKDDFYRTANETTQRIMDLIDMIGDDKFVAKAAIWARTECHTRSVTHLIAGILAKRAIGAEWKKNFYKLIVERPDDMLEIASYILSEPNASLPNSLKKGFAEVLSSLDEYRLAKYKKASAELSMYDLVNLVHPKATPALNKLMTGKLAPAETWETKLTQAGQAGDDEDKDELRNAAWRDLITANKLGYFALLRNLRNIALDSPETLDLALSQLVDPNRIKGSKVLPLRFVTAITTLNPGFFESQRNMYGYVSNSRNITDPTQIRKITDALAEALEISVDNVPLMDGISYITLDDSGSMSGQPWDVASVFAAALYKKNNADLCMFSSSARYVTNISRRDSLMTIINRLNTMRTASGTNFHKPFEIANKKYDRVFILSDMQGWMPGSYYSTGGSPTETFARYKKTYNAKPKVYSIDCKNYGTLQFPEKDVFAVAGLSDKIFDIIASSERDPQAMINDIEKILL